MEFHVAKSCGAQGRKNIIIAAGALVIALSASTGAIAQAPPQIVPANCGAPAQTGTAISNIGTIAFAAGATSSALSSAIGNVNTAFLTTQGSAFVSAPANPAPDQPGGGIWVRGVGGHVTDKSTTNGTVTASNLPGNPPVANTTTTSCANSSGQNFAGVQVGADIARLNWSGWNVHLGTTAGYLGSNSVDNNGFSNSFQVPFFGTYVVATKGRFFADLMVREEFYNTTLTNTVFALNSLPVGAHGYSIATSAGYNFDLGQGWFIEPSAGFIYSKTTVDNFTLPGSGFTGGTNGIAFTVNTPDVTSEIGRATVRVGKSIESPSIVWQPFASASVLSEFAGNTTSTFISRNAVFPFPGGNPINIGGQVSTSRVGTYGQYSLGISGQVVNTGWLGFARVDYRDGANIEGWTGNVGIRYQFTPEMVASVMPTKALKAPTSFIPATNWTGFYVGGFLGGAYGRTDIAFITTPLTAGSKPWVFGGLGGGEIGYNRQFNNWVVGVEGDVGATNAHGSQTAGTVFPFNPGPFTSGVFSAQDKTNWMATATARVGYAMGRVLYYVKGGGAFEDSTVSVTCFGGGQTCTNQAGVATNGFNTSSTRAGWTLGFGSEFDLGKNWSAKTEYDYLSFGRHTATATDGTTIMTDRANISQVKVGLNYRFGPALVVAKY